MSIGIPSQPYDATIEGLLKVEGNMKSRKGAIQKYLTKNEKLITMSSYPRLGVEPLSLPHNRVQKIERESYSKHTDNIVYPSPRYQ